MFDTSRDCTMQSTIVMTTNGAENFDAVDGANLNESSELIEMEGKASTWESDAFNENLEVTKNDFALNLVASDCPSKCGTTGEGFVTRYTRSVLEAQRFVDVDGQRRKWNEIHKDLETVISQEYDEISINSQKKLNWNYGQPQRQEKKKEASTSKNELFVESIRKVSDALEISGHLDGNNFDEENWAMEEEQYEEDDSDEEYDSIQHPAFFVEGEPDFDSGPPQDGWEYLRRVRWEAAQMPKVKVAKLDRSKWSTEQTPYMPRIPEIARCPENLSPLKNWVDLFLADFSELRQVFSASENSTDRALVTQTVKDFREDSLGLQMRKNIPTVSAILGMDSVSRAAMLRNRIKAFESASILSRDSCLWIFALCVAVDTPFDAEMSSCLRCLLRKCSSLLAEKPEFDEEVAMLNILIVISGKYFGQSENLSCWS